MYDIHAEFISAAMTVLRNISAAALPLIGPAIYKRLGLGKENSVLGTIAIQFTPLPMNLMRHEERMRQSVLNS